MHREGLQTIACRCCGQEQSAASLDQESAEHSGFVLVIDLGCTPLANRFLEKEELAEADATYPLRLVLCRNCGLLQITETVPPEVLFRHYTYFSSFADTQLESSRALAERLVQERGLNADSLVIEAGSNDGYLLQHFANHAIPVLGIDPARNVADEANAHEVPTLAEFFGIDLAEQLVREDRQADVLIANNVLAHVADLAGFVQGIEKILKPGGVASIEFPYVVDMIQRLEFDTIYHEHLCYFSLTVADRIFRTHGLAVTDVERLVIHGGSLRLTVERVNHAKPTAAVTRLLAEEAELRVDQPEFFHGFDKRVLELKAKLLSLLSELSSQGNRLAAYGAAAKGTTLLNFCGIGSELIPYVVDRNPHKQGRYVPGIRVPICSPERLLEDRPDYVLLLTWNLAEEILDQQAAFREAGGKFILPGPEPRCV